jgi:diguanylate cyclase
MIKFLSSNDADFVLDTSSTALNLMTKYNVLPTPKNYHLWFSHTAKSDLNLSNLIDGMITKKVTFNDEINDFLYEKFFAAEKEQKAVTEAGTNIQSELAKIAVALKESGKTNSDYANTLLAQKDILNNFEGASELRDIIDVILTDTKKVEDQGHQLEEELNQSSLKIQQLQTKLENARLESRTDTLTNIGNRRCFDEKLDENVTLTVEDNKDTCLILSDIDFFKKFNDTYGHKVGDQVLKVVAHTMKTIVGIKGTPLRYGGEEFAVILPDTKLEDALKIAESIREVIAKRVIRNKSSGQNFGKITMSFGVAACTKNDSADSLTKRADSALYLAKSNGRHMVQSEQELDTVISGQERHQA